MTDKLEQVEYGLFVARDVVERWCAYDFADEHMMMPVSYGQREDPEYKGNSIIEANFKLHEVFEIGQLVTCNILNCLTQTYPKADMVAINYQPGLSEQTFHVDDAVGPVVVLSGGDNGSYDYSIEASSVEEALNNFSTIDVDAGDLIIQMVGGRYHRGRNRGADPRITMALWQSGDQA